AAWPFEHLSAISSVRRRSFATVDFDPLPAFDLRDDDEIAALMILGTVVDGDVEDRIVEFEALHALLEALGRQIGTGCLERPEQRRGGAVAELRGSAGRLACFLLVSLGPCLHVRIVETSLEVGPAGGGV